MGGFLFNGCGASDSYKKVMDIKQAYCRFCKKVQMFGLYELDRKIRIVYIPTITTSRKCAVICPKCKNGVYVEDAMRDAILMNRAEVMITQNGIEIKVPEQNQQPGRIPQNPGAATPRAADSGSLPGPNADWMKDIFSVGGGDVAQGDRSSQPSQPSGSAEASGTRDPQGVLECLKKNMPFLDEKALHTSQQRSSSSGAETAHNMASSSLKRSRKYCSGCGMNFSSSSNFCPVCGRKLSDS